MILDCVEVHASPNFSRATCPKHHCEMIEISNGWFSLCWYCEKCKYPYQLMMSKMRNVNKENLKKVLEKAKAKK